MGNEKNTIRHLDGVNDSEAEICRLLGELKRVKAPSDFDVRVRARIAEGRPQIIRSFRFPYAVRYAAGLSVVLVFVGLLGFVSLYRWNRVEPPPIAGIEPDIQRPQLNSLSNEGVATANRAGDTRKISTSPVSDDSARLPMKEPARGSLPVDPKEDISGSSQTLSQREGKKVYPKGINPNAARLPTSTEFENVSHLQAIDVLSILGIKATFVDRGWRVDFVNVNSTAERVGVKSGDVIEAINDQAIQENTPFGGSLSLRSLRIRRDGQVLKEYLTNK